MTGPNSSQFRWLLDQVRHHLETVQMSESAKSDIKDLAAYAAEFEERLASAAEAWRSTKEPRDVVRALGLVGSQGKIYHRSWDLGGLYLILTTENPFGKFDPAAVSE